MILAEGARLFLMLSCRKLQQCRVGKNRYGFPIKPCIADMQEMGPLTAEDFPVGLDTEERRIGKTLLFHLSLALFGITAQNLHDHVFSFVRSLEMQTFS